MVPVGTVLGTGTHGDRWWIPYLKDVAGLFRSMFLYLVLFHVTQILIIFQAIPAHLQRPCEALDTVLDLADRICAIVSPPFPVVSSPSASPVAVLPDRTVAVPPEGTVAIPPETTVAILPVKTIGIPPVKTVGIPPVKTVGIPPEKTVAIPPEKTFAIPPAKDEATVPPEKKARAEDEE